MGSASKTPNSWTRTTATPNNFLFDGGDELNPTTGLYDLEFRNYDPALGRMTQVDPMSHKYSSHTPYNYAFNSPVVMEDLNGADPGSGYYVDDKYSRYYQNLYSSGALHYMNYGGNSYTLQLMNYSPSDFGDATGYGMVWGEGMTRDAATMSASDYAAKWGTTLTPEQQNNFISAISGGDLNSLVGVNSVGQLGYWSINVTGATSMPTELYNGRGGIRQGDMGQMNITRIFNAFEINDGGSGGWAYDIPGIGSAKRAADALDNGNYFQAAGWEAWGVFELTGAVALYKAIASQAGMALAKVATSRSVTIFRAVDAAEAASIRNTGQFSLQAGGTEVKYFAKSLGDANWYGQRLYPTGYSIISADASNTIIQYWYSNIDIGAYAIPGEALPNIVPRLK